MVLATDRADVNKTVRKHLDVRKISFAGMDDAVGQTGMEYGGITPIGLPASWPILVDDAVRRVWTGSSSAAGSAAARSPCRGRQLTGCPMPRSSISPLALSSAGQMIAATPTTTMITR